MAAVNSERVRTRSGKTIITNISYTRAGTTRSSKVSSSVADESDSEDLSEMVGRPYTRARRKRRRIDSEDENKEGEEEATKSKKTRVAARNIKTKECQVPIKKLPLSTIKKKTVYTEKTARKDSLDEEESSSEKESGVASSYSSASSSSSSSSDSDSPIPTSELSDSSPGVDTSTYESSGNEDISWRIRKSPRKQAQAKTRRKIAELCAHKSDSEDSTTSSESSYVSDD